MFSLKEEETFLEQELSSQATERTKQLASQIMTDLWALQNRRTQQRQFRVKLVCL